MRKIDAEEMKRIQLDILRYVHQWCITNDVHYWLDCGTLLGCIRHNGYIPWDDDIDIGMLRKDYETFCSEFNNQKSKYKVVCIDNDASFYQPYAKVLDTTTLLIDSGHRTCINIDVFVYDNAPNNDCLVKKMFDRRDRLRLMSGYQISYRPDANGKRGSQLAKKCFHIMLNLLPKGFFVKLQVYNCKRYNRSNTNRVGNFSSYSRNGCDKSVFNDFIYGSFEGFQFYIPIGFDKWLSSFYGDYMKLPPENQRISHHIFEAYIDE